ncbi:TRAP transporter small permease [Mangrovicoccus algicola]|uniref:TRAP transporter small permease protein n=1 Tax=Mangrovicoccus algicola TaxID=2771008 RepID=A0A8J6Z7L0_9RHOB|nr:TRAP transporter small permease [Mangrovicoccus algicola]MBE3637940.1 TRAP transporter small permease [Mangrovicoccus algicola]
MRQLRRLTDGIVGAACCLLLAAMVAVLAWQVFSRYVLNAPSTFSEEILRFGLVWLSLLGAAYSTGRGTHMAVTLLRDLVRPAVQRVLDLLVPLAFLVFGIGVLGLGGLRAMQIASGQTTAVLQLPMAAVYAAIPVSGLFISIYSLLNLADLLRQRRERPDEVEAALNWGD